MTEIYILLTSEVEGKVFEELVRYLDPRELLRLKALKSFAPRWKDEVLSLWTYEHFPAFHTLQRDSESIR